VTQQPLQLDVQSSKVEKVSIRREIHKQVDIAGWLVFASRNATEDSYVRGLVLLGDGDDLVPVLVEQSPEL
jgi:hypothetical protein